MPNPMEMSAGIRNGKYDGVNDNTQSVVDPEAYSQAGSPNGPLITENTGDAVAAWAKENGYKLSDETLDYIYNQFFTEKNNESAWQRTLDADNSKYQRAVEDMKKAGLNPFLLMSNGVSNAGNSSPGSVGYGSISSRKNSQTQANAQGVGAVLGILGAILGALILSA